MDAAPNAYEPASHGEQCAFATSRLNLPGSHASHGLPVETNEKPEVHEQLSTLVLEALDSAPVGQAAH
jgi:hypothetical protein